MKSCYKLFGHDQVVARKTIEMEALVRNGGVGFNDGIFYLIQIAFYLSPVYVQAKKCGKTYKLDHISPLKKIKIDLPPRGPKCYAHIFGDENCDVELSCKVDIPRINEDCDEEVLKVTDGSMGYKKYCGSTLFSKLRANRGLRDLFLVLETQGAGGSKNFSGIQCVAKCADKNAGLSLGFSSAEHRLPHNIVRKQDTRCVCGLNHNNQEDRIVGGEDSDPNEWPWQAAVVFPDTRSPISGASVINDRYVLTSAHTFAFGKKKNLTAGDIEVIVHAHLLDMTIKKDHNKNAKMGEDGSIQGSGWDLGRKSDIDERTQRFQVIEIIPHPLFTKFFDYDYALLKLNKKVNFAGTDPVTPVCLPPEDTWDTLQNSWTSKQMLTVTGWGLSAENAGATTRILQKVDLPYINFDLCQKYNPQLITRRMICAGFEQGGKDACSGDSGGPLVYQAPSKQYWQVGIVSWGDGCGRQFRPGFYARVTEMMQWIHLYTNEGGAKWCKQTQQ